MSATDWACYRCTYLNRSDSTFCEMCLAEHKKSIKGNVPIAQQFLNQQNYNENKYHQNQQSNFHHHPFQMNPIHQYNPNMYKASPPMQEFKSIEPLPPPPPSPSQFNPIDPNKAVKTVSMFTTKGSILPTVYVRTSSDLSIEPSQRILTAQILTKQGQTRLLLHLQKPSSSPQINKESIEETIVFKKMPKISSKQWKCVYDQNCLSIPRLPPCLSCQWKDEWYFEIIGANRCFTFGTPDSKEQRYGSLHLSSFGEYAAKVKDIGKNHAIDTTPQCFNIMAICPANKACNCTFKISASLNTEVKDFKEFLVKCINDKFSPLKFRVVFPNELEDCWDRLSLRCFYKLLPKGIDIKVRFTLLHYEHRTESQEITCPHMVKIGSNHPLHCPVYYSMKQDYIYNEDNLNHLNEFVHLRDEYGEKAKCKYYEHCKAFIRLENGDCKISDLCHIKLYRHPPRTRNIKLSENMNAMVMNKDSKKNQPLYRPTEKDAYITHVAENAQTPYSNEVSKSCYLASLLIEVVTNGYAYDLCLDCTEDDECKCGDYAIMRIVDEKLKNKRNTMRIPLNQADMLALILYTGLMINLYNTCPC